VTDLRQKYEIQNLKKLEKLWTNSSVTLSEFEDNLDQNLY